MSVVGHQDFWVVGSRMYFKRDAIGGTAQPWMDLGVIETANPNFETEKLTLQDSDGGLKRIVDEAVASIDETYDIVCSNLNMENLSLLFLADRPESFVQTAEEDYVVHAAVKGYLLKIHDDDADSTLLFNMTSIIGVTDGGSLTEVTTLGTIVKATKTLTFIGVDLTAPLAAGKKFMVHADGLADKANARSYTIVSSSFPAADTIVVVEQSPSSDETGLTGTTRVSYENAGKIYDPTDDWEVVSLDRGFIRILSTGAIATGSVTVYFYKTALTGSRQFNPQESQDEVKGEVLIFWGRDINSRQTVRQGRVSLTPNTTALSADDFSSMTLSARIINDLTADTPAGRVVFFKGDLPATS